MKNFLKNSKLCLLALAFASACAALPARAQQTQKRDDRLISAYAGGVNLVSGDVRARGAGKDEWRSLSVKDNLKSGDAARTGADGRVEVLLNPGSYMRAGASTEFEMTDASLYNLRLRITRGSVVVEATGYGDLGIDIEVATPQTRVGIVRSGIYRIDVTPSGETLVSVQKGRALVGEGAAALVVKGGKTAGVGAGGAAQVAKLDKKQRDDLDLWSRERGKELAKINEALANKQTNTMLASFNFNSFMLSAEFPSDFYGLWMWSAGRSCYTFLPFYAGWRSPYGFGYGSVFSPYGANCWACPWRDYRPTIIRNANPQGTYTPNTTIVRGATTSSPGGSTTGGRTITPLPQPRVSPPDAGNRARDRAYDPGTRPRDQ